MQEIGTRAPDDEAPPGIAPDVAADAGTASAARGLDTLAWQLDPAGGMPAASASWSAFTGQSSAEAAGRGWLEALHPDDRAGVEAACTAALQGDAATRLRCRIRRADAAYRSVQLDLAPAGGPVPGERTAVAVDITELLRDEQAWRSAQRRLRFLDRLAVATRGIEDASEVMSVATRALGRELAATRCAYADVQDDNDGFTIRNDWSLPGVASSAGAYSLDLFGALAASNLRRGRHLVVRDVDFELGEAGGAAMFNAIGIKAIVCAGLVKEGRLVAMMAVHQAQPRDWSGDEVALIAEVVERCWSHIERVRDAAVRSAAVAALEASQARLQAITHSIDQMVWSTRADGWHDFYNDRWYEYTGVPHGSTDGEAWNGLFHADDQERAWAVWRESLRTGKPYHIEYRLRHASGVYRWVLGRAQPVRDADGGISRWYGTCTDIQDIVDARELLARSHGELERRVGERTRERDLAWSLSLDLQAVLDSHGHFRAVNDAWHAILGWRADEVIGRHHLEFNHSSHHAQSAHALAAALDGVLPAYETECLHKDGSTRWISWVAASEGGLVYASGRDVTPAKEAAAVLEATRQQLRQSQKMEAIGQLTGGIAHDFNNLLAGISASLELLAKRLAQGRFDSVDRYVEMAKGSTRRAATLTQRLLAFSRRQTLEPKPTDVNRLVAGIEELVQRTVGPAIKVEVIRDAALWTANLDAPQLENALLNLCINARDAMLPGGGRLVIQTTNHAFDAAGASVHELAAGHYISVCVIDTGCGMTPEVAARAFDPFFTTKPLGQGTGLGLSMIYGFVRQSGGHVRIDTEPGRGTTMCMYFPRHDGAASDPERAPSQDDSGSAEGETVVVIDDEATIRSLVTEVLADAGLRVLAAEDGPAGLLLFEQAGRVDLLVSDVGLPGGLNGRQLADAVRVARPEMKVLFITGYDESAALGSGELPHGMALRTKPFEMSALSKKVLEMLRA